MTGESIESVLEEYNRKIDHLESSDPRPEELLEAYVNRGSILVMMDSYISALSDFEEAADIIEDMASMGIEVNEGTFVKTYYGIGRMSDTGEMDAAYAKAASRLDELGEDSRHYDAEHIVYMCMTCAEDLFGAGLETKAEPFLIKIMDLLSGRRDKWSKNRLTEAYGLSGQIWQLEDKEKSIQYFEKAISTARSLYNSEELDDPMELALALVSLGDIHESRGLPEDAVELHIQASQILAKMHNEGSIEDAELLAGLYNGIASIMFLLGRDAEAEKYMVMAARAEAGSDQ